MENTKILKIEILILPVIIIAFGAILRLLPHPPNMAPIAAMALFGGVYLNRKYALIVPILAMVASDIFLGFNASTPLVYASFVLSGVIGLSLKNHKSLSGVLGGTIISSIIFFFLTNFNFWYATSLYPKTFDGMIQAYVMAIPFFRNTIMGDIMYVGLFFGSFEIVSSILKNKYAYIHQKRG